MLGLVGVHRSVSYCQPENALTYQGSSESIVGSVDASYGFQLTRTCHHLQSKIRDLHIRVGCSNGQL